MTKPETVFQGTGVSPGVAVGTALKLDSRSRVVLKLSAPAHRIEAEIVRFERALQVSREQIAGLKSCLEDSVGPEHSYVLDAHMLMLEDRALLSEIVSTIRKGSVNAEWAVRKATDRIRKAYGALEDPYFRERGSDIESVYERIVMNLAGTSDAPHALPDDLIIVARDFDASSFAHVEPSKIRGLALESGGNTSHTAIIARALRIPAVMEVRGGMVSAVNAGDVVMLDGDAGEVVLNPAPGRVERASSRSGAAASESAPAEAAAPARTADGTAVSLLANLELPHEVRAARRFGAEGVGLFRSEFLFFAHPHGFPGLEEQVETYRMLAEEMAPLPVCIRTLDADPDRVFGRGEHAASSGSPMGLRGIRLSLASRRARALFETQIEAILRASPHGRLKIVLPMVSSLEEVREAKSVVAGVARRIPGLPAEPVRLGIMIEVPAAVLQLELLAREADFLAVGTNDLIQYTLAVDRCDAHVQHLYQPLHPAVLHALSRIAHVAETSGKPVTLCGEIAANPLFAALLVGIGFRRLSMNPYSIPALRQAVGGLTIELVRRVAARVLEMGTAKEAGDFLFESLAERLELDTAGWAVDCGLRNVRQ